MPSWAWGRWRRTQVRRPGPFHFCGAALRTLLWAGISSLLGGPRTRALPVL